MGVRYNAAASTAAAPGITDEIIEIRNSTTRRMYVVEIGVFTGAATATGVGLVRCSAQGTNGTSVAGQSEDPNITAAATGAIYTAVTTGLTLGTNYLRRAMLPAAIGAGIIWTWPPGNELILGTSSSTAVVNISAAVGANPTHAYCVWFE